MGESGPASRRRTGRLALGMGVAALALAMALATSRPSELRATLTVGPSDTTRYQMARALAEAARAQGVAVRLVETRSSDDELDLVNKGRADLALVSGAHVFDRYGHLREVAQLYPEALHLLVKEELAESVGVSLVALRGRTVDLGPPGSTTAGMASAVMSFAGPGSAEGGSGEGFSTLSLEQRKLEDLSRRGIREAMPDAVFHLGTLPSMVALRLVRSQRYRLVPLPFADAFRLNALIEEAPREGPASEIDSHCVTDTIIPAYTYRRAPPIPCTRWGPACSSCPTIAFRRKS